MTVPLCRTRLASAASFLVLLAGATAQIPLAGQISDATTGPLLSGQTYVATQNLVVPSGATLTIQPGAVLKMQITQIIVFGTVNAVGTPANPIVFTSRFDDTVGIPAMMQAPAPGDWSGFSLQANSDATRFEWCTFRYAGRNNNPSVFGFKSDFTMLDCQILDGMGSGCVNQDTSLPNIERCHAARNGGFPFAGLNWPGLPLFVDNTATDNGAGDAPRVDSRLVNSSVTVGPRNGVGGTLLLNAGFDVRANGTVLELLPGVILKIAANASDLLTIRTGATVRGLGAAGAPVIFTSAADDSVGVDADGNGVSVGTPGGWRYIDIGQNATLDCDFTEFRFAGRVLRTLLSQDSNLRLHDCTISGSANSGLDFNGGAADPRLPDVRRCAFNDNVGRPLRSIDFDAVSRFFDCTATGNGGGDHVTVGSQSFTSTRRIARHNTFNGSGVIQCNGLSVVGAQIIEFGPGVILKLEDNRGVQAFNLAQMRFEGRGDAPVIVTSIRDDEFGGDTNGDGTATTPFPGAIFGLRWSFGATGSSSHVRVRYAGGNSASAGIHCASGSQVRLVSSRVDFSAVDGFSIATAIDPVANLVAWKNLGVGIHMTAGGYIVQHATSTENNGFGILGEPNYTGLVFNSIAWNNVDNTEPNNFVGVRDRCRNCNGILVNGNLFADPLFVDPINTGDLHIAPTSLCVGQGDVIQATAFGEDHDGNSRLIDHTDGQLTLPDIGAYEVFRYRMVIGGEARLGRTVAFAITGPGPTGGGMQVAILGPAVGGEFLPAFGVSLIGPLATWIPFAAGPVGSGFALTIPDDVVFLGGRFGVQTLVVPNLAFFAGHLTNPLLATITE